MASRVVEERVGTDLTGCDREPIHIPGSIQQHGLLLIADVRTLSVVGGAGAIEARLGQDWLGRPLSELLGREIGDALSPVTAGPGGTVVVAPVTLEGARFNVSLHRAGEVLLVELEPATAEVIAAGVMLGWLDELAHGFERASDLDALCERAAVAFRTLTGFDRVMVYRFLDDDAGRVVAEDRDPSLSTFMHHHFPASDIPRQARALYVRNRARSIPDIDYAPQPIRPAAQAHVDLSDVGVRSVSPIHIEYLRNMGVRASASISIVRDGLLWGLIACHHRTPRLLPADLRQAAAVLASSLARQIAGREEAETYRQRLRMRAAEDGLPLRMGEGSSLFDAVRKNDEDLRSMLAADGFALVAGRQVATTGNCPSNDICRELAAWTQARTPGEVFATHHLASLRPDLAGEAALSSGLLAIPLMDENASLLFFRVEQVEEIEWAGNPHKAVPAVPGAMLTPRSSFATWVEAVRGRSRRWTLEELEAGRRLRRTFHDAHRTRQLRDVNADLTRTVAEKDALIAQKDVLMKEVDHRVQNSLQLVSAFLSMQARAAGPGEVADQLAEAQARLSAVALVHRRLYRDDQIETIDLSRYLEELVADLKSSLGQEWASGMRVDLAPVLIPTDRAVNIGLIMTELVINATKYAYRGAPGPIAIALEQHRARLRLIVADEGVGKSGEHSGFGSRMMTAMVARLDGELRHDSNNPGLRAILTAPIVEV